MHVISLILYILMVHFDVGLFSERIDLIVTQDS